METRITEQDIINANFAEMMEEERPTPEQRKKDLEKIIGTFEDCLMDWIENS